MNAVFALGVIAEGGLEMQRDIYMSFVDFAKAFDTVKHEDMVNRWKDI